jgi:NAD(P)H-dependent FMN reductase
MVRARLVDTPDPRTTKERTVNPRLEIISSSTRPGRVGPTVAAWIAGMAREHTGFDVHTADLAEIGLPLLDEPEHPAERTYLHQHTRDWSERIDAADAFVIVTPEYNRGMPAPLKNALDYLDGEWHYKPVGFVGYGMTSQGLRAVQMAAQVVSALRMTPLAEVVPVPLRQVLDDTGQLHPTAQMSGIGMAMLAELERFSAVLALLRDKAVR